MPFLDTCRCFSRCQSCSPPAPTNGMRAFPRTPVMLLKKILSWLTYFFHGPPTKVRRRFRVRFGPDPRPDNLQRHGRKRRIITGELRQRVADRSRRHKREVRHHCMLCGPPLSSDVALASASPGVRLIDAHAFAFAFSLLCLCLQKLCEESKDRPIIVPAVLPLPALVPEYLPLPVPPLPDAPAQGTIPTI